MKNGGTIYAEFGQEPVELGDIGRVGENLARRIVFDCQEVLESCPGAQIVCAALRQGEWVPYPVSLEDMGEEKYALTLTSTELARVGEVRFELRAVDGDTVLKSAMFTGRVLRSLGEIGDVPGTPVADVLNLIGRQAAQIKQNRLDIIELQNKEIDLSGYATVDYVDNAVDNIDLTPYAKKTDIPTKVSAFTNDAGYLTTHQSLTNYYTKSEVDAKIPDDVDLSNYYTKTQVDALIDDYVTENELNSKGFLTEHQSLDGYAKTMDIPDVSAYQTEEQVLALIQANMPASGDEVSY